METPPATLAPLDIGALAAREAIRDCLYRYCRGIDRVDEAALRSAYWPDATDCHGAFRGTASGFIDKALAHLRRGGRGVHQIHNILIELTGDSAEVESYFSAYQSRADESGLWHQTDLHGRYLDHFERRCGLWRIARRTVVYDWMEDRPRPELADLPALLGPRQPVGTHWPHDPLYQTNSAGV